MLCNAVPQLRGLHAHIVKLCQYQQILTSSTKHHVACRAGVFVFNVWHRVRKAKIAAWLAVNAPERLLTGLSGAESCQTGVTSSAAGRGPGRDALRPLRCICSANPACWGALAALGCHSWQARLSSSGRIGTPGDPSSPAPAEVTEKVSIAKQPYCH